MSSSSTMKPGETPTKKLPEEIKVSPKTADSIVATETGLKTEPVMNGALPENSSVKSVVGNGVTSEPTAVNGQEDKPAPGDATHREIPGLLPLQPVTVTTSIPQSVSSSTAVKQPPPLLPMNTNTTSVPVVATKSAPPPVTTSPTTTKTSNKSPSKEQQQQQFPTSSLKAKRNDPKGKDAVVKDCHLDVIEKEAAPTKNKRVGRKKRPSVASSDSTEKGDGDSGGDGRKSKRARTKTQPFQSSDMDLNLLRAIKATAAAAASQQVKLNEDKLVVFFKGEHLAVRNAEGGFYICQAMQNINRGSHKIRIRWLSQAEAGPSKSKKKAQVNDNNADVKDESGFDVYTPDFYDNTDFECILTNLELEKLGRDRFGLPLVERQRTENILRRAIQVEEGVVDQLEVTEEHPDGLDVSLFHDESQLTKKNQKSDGESSGNSSDDESFLQPSSSSRDQAAVVASTSTGVGSGTKRTRAAAVAAALKKIQMKSYDDDESSDC